MSSKMSSKRDRKWSKQFELFRQFIGEYGIENATTSVGVKRLEKNRNAKSRNTNIDHSKYKGLGDWIVTQRKSNSKSSLSVDRFNQLHRVGFVWQVHKHKHKAAKKASASTEPQRNRKRKAVSAKKTPVKASAKKASGKAKTIPASTTVEPKRKSAKVHQLLTSQQPTSQQTAQEPQEMVYVPKQWLLSKFQQMQQMVQQQMIQQQMIQQQMAQRQRQWQMAQQHMVQQQYNWGHPIGHL